MKWLIARNTFKTKTGCYEGFSEQYVQEVLEKSPSHKDNKPMEVTRQPQDHLVITGLGALANTDAKIQDAPEVMVKLYSHEQVQ
jgi:hypothetical protein